MFLPAQISPGQYTGSEPLHFLPGRLVGPGELVAEKMDILAYGVIIVLLVSGTVYAVDAAASSGRLGGLWRGAGVTLAGVLTIVGSALVGLALLDDQRSLPAGIGVLASGVSLGFLLNPRGRRWISRALPLDAASTRDWLGLLALVWLVILRLTLFYEDRGDEVGEVRLAEAAVQTMVLVGIACALVGMFTRRDLRLALERLGIRGLSVRSYVVSAALVIPFTMVAAATALAVEVVQPGTLDRLEDTVSGMTGGNTSLQFGLLLGISAAVGEETLFRGALQPKYGLFFTSLVFALLHVQYDLLLIVGSLFPVGLILGLERKYLGTTAAIITHALYNALAVVSGY